MMLLKQCLELAILAWLPGAVIFRLPWLDRDRRAALDAEERVFWAIVLSVVVSLSIVLTLASLHRYSLERLLRADAIVAAVAALLARGHLRLGPAARAPGPTAIIPVALVLLGELLHSRELLLIAKELLKQVQTGVGRRIGLQQGDGH